MRNLTCWWLPIDKTFFAIFLQVVTVFSAVTLCFISFTNIDKLAVFQFVSFTVAVFSAFSFYLPYRLKVNEVFFDKTFSLSMTFLWLANGIMRFIIMLIIVCFS